MGWFNGLGAFVGKVIAVYCRDEQGAMLRDVRIERLGGRNFLVGELAPRESREWSGVPCWIAIDEVVKIFIFDDIEDARQLFTLSEAEKPRI